MLSAPLDIFRVRLYFNAITAVRELVSGARRDVGFLGAVREAVLPLPHDRGGATERHPFPRAHHRPHESLRGSRIAVVTTGGSGALACLVGVARALEEGGTPAAAYSVCSGAALFGFPLAAGRTAGEVAERTLSVRGRDWVDPDWGRVLALVPTLARGFSGVMRGDRIEDWYRGWLGDIRLGELATPCWERRPVSIVHAASQVRSAQHLEHARANLARLRRETPGAVLIDPVPYAAVQGVGLYREFIDNRRWPEYMRSGRTETMGALRRLAAAATASRRSPGCAPRRDGVSLGGLGHGPGRGITRRPAGPPARPGSAPRRDRRGTRRRAGGRRAPGPPV
jgi:hypothetical protein